MRRDRPVDRRELDDLRAVLSAHFKITITRIDKELDERGMQTIQIHLTEEPSDELRSRLTPSHNDYPIEYKWPEVAPAL